MDTIARFRLNASLAVLLIFNLVPLAGVLFFGWSVFEVMLVFWAENVVIGLFNVLRLVVASITQRDSGGFFLTPFFTVHYGIFTLVHGLFVIAIFGGYPGLPSSATPFFDMYQSVVSFLAGNSWFTWALLSLVASHGFPFVMHFLIGGERHRLELSTLMFAPYSRVVILHLVIMGGGFAVLQLGSPLYALLLLVVLKIIIDAWSHWRSHRATQPLTMSTVATS